MSSKKREQAKQTAAIQETAGMQERLLAELAGLRSDVLELRAQIETLALPTKETKSTKGKKSEGTE